jgi:hypothetical protein
MLIGQARNHVSLRNIVKHQLNPETPQATQAMATYQRVLVETTELEKKNIEAYDKALLTLSSAFLGGSITFIDNLVALERAVLLPMLYVGWGLFVTTIAVAIGGYIYALQSLSSYKKLAKKFLIDGDEEAGRKMEHKWGVRVVNTLSGASFLCGLVALTIFAGINFDREVHALRDQNSTNAAPARVERALPTPSTLDQFIVPVPAATQSPSNTPTPATTSPQTAPAATGQPGGQAPTPER